MCERNAAREGGANEGEKKGKKEENQPACARTHSKTGKYFWAKSDMEAVYVGERMKSVPRVREL